MIALNKIRMIALNKLWLKILFTVVLILFVLLAGCTDKKKRNFNTYSNINSNTFSNAIYNPYTTADKINLSMGNKINLSIDYNGRQIELTNGQTFNVTLEQIQVWLLLGNSRT